MALTEQSFRNIFIYIIPRFATYGLQLLTLPIFTRLLSPEDFGVVTLAYAVPSIAVSIVTAGFVSSVPRFFFEFRKDKGKLNALYFSTQLYLIVALCITSLGVFFAKDYAARVVTGATDYGAAIFIAYLATYFGKMITFYLRIYQNMEKAALHSFFVVLQIVLSISISLVLVWHYGLSYMGMLYGSMAGAFVAFIAMALHFNRGLMMHFDREILMENIKYGLQVVPKTFTGFINRFFDKYMLNAMLSMSVVGVFSIGQRIATTLDIIMDNIWMSFQPAYYRDVFDRGEEASEGVGRIFTIFSYISLFPILMVILLAKELMYLVAPPEYYGAASIIIILSAGTTTQIFGKYTSVQYAYSKKPFWIFPTTVIGALFNIGANIVLIPKYGLQGAGFATVASTVIMNVILASIGQRLYRIKYEWGTILPLMGLITLTMLFMLSSDRLMLSPFVLYAIKFACIVLYALIGVKAGIVTRSSISKIRGLLKKSPERKEA